jgi:Glycosyl transferases group 1/Glycosyl transferase 4-like domain
VDSMERHQLRILVLSFYFQPDLSAGSFRATTLVDALLVSMAPGSAIDVITTAPNRYSSFKQDFPPQEKAGPLTVTRIDLPVHRSDLWGQSRAFFHFAWHAMRLTAGRDYDLVFATSSRLMTAALGARIARRLRARLYLDIRDIFVDTIRDVFPTVAKGLAPLLSAVEKWTMRRANRINLVSRGFEDYFRARYPDKSFAWFTNGIDDEFLSASWSGRSRQADAPLLVLYAGNIGEGQGLHAILPQLARKLGARVHFRIIGDGGRRDLLCESLRRAGVQNVEVTPPIPRAELLRAYLEADILFLHLNSHAAFEKVLPSKLFEYAATGKPIWAGVAGYAARFIAAEVGNSAVFAPCDAEDAIAKLGGLILHYEPRGDFVARYARRNIAREMAEDILNQAKVDRS